jgi:hypothetical protein
MRLGAVLVVLLLNTLVCSAQGGAVNITDTPQSRVNALADRLRTNSVQRIEIIQMPPRMLTRTRITPEMLEKSFHYKLIIRDIRGGVYVPSLTAAVASTSADSAPDPGDLRWGIAFFDQNERRIAFLYYDASGRHGAVDTSPVVFKGDLLKWLDDNFSRALK